MIRSLVALALLSTFFCIKLLAAPAAQFPALPPSFCSSISSSSCNLSFPASSCLSLKSPFSNVTLHLPPLASLSFFYQSSLSLLTHPFTFTASYSDTEDAPPPTLAFFLVSSPQLPYSCPSSSQSITLHCITESCFSHEFLLICTALTQPLPYFLAPPSCSHLNPDPHKTSDEIRFKNEVSLSYDTDAAALRVQAIDYSLGSKINQTFTLSTHDRTVSNEKTTLFVGYMTSGEATINVTSGEPTINSAPSPNMSDPGPTHEDNSKSMKVVVGVIVGVSLLGFLMGLLIIFITKRRGRSSLVTPPSAGHGAPPAATANSPTSYHDLESGATPMMRALPLSPPYADAFQISGTASWLKQPNPR